MLVVLCAVVGLAIGSFLTVVIARVPAGESLVRPRSRCPRCGTPVSPRDNVPVLGWLLLRGTARCCGARIPARYPLVEATTSASFAALAAWVGLSWRLPALLYLAAISIALAVIDWETFRLPVRIVLPAYPVAAVLLGVAAFAEPDAARAVRMLAGAVALWGLYRLLHLIYPAGMGYGDVRLAGVMGLYLGWAGWNCLVVGAFAGFFLGGVVAITLVLLGKRKLSSHIPYGPYLLAGTWIGLAAGEPIAAAYLRGTGL